MIALDAGLPVQHMQPGGLVSPPDLRAYARVRRYRPDKDPGEADTIDDLRHLLRTGADEAG